MKPAYHKLTAVVQGLGVVVVLGVVTATLVPLDSALARSLGNNAPYVLAAVFFTGLLALPAKLPALMKTSWLAAAVMAVVLRSSVSDVTPERTRPIEPLRSDFSVTQVSTGNFSSLPPFGIEALADPRTDVICVQQLTPNWCEYLSAELAASFPYHYTYEDIGLQGIGVYSRRPLGYVDTVHLAGVVHLTACESGQGATPEVGLFAVQTLPPVNSIAYYRLRSQFEIVADHLAASTRPLIVLGDFNSVPWSDELQDFQDETALLDSRRSIQSTFVKGAPQLFEVPVEHIFYSPRLRCLNYETIRGEDGYLGNRATFQDKSVPVPLASL